MSGKGKYVCGVCGGESVQHAMWVGLNDKELHEDFGSWCNGDNSWCGDCDEHVEIKFVEVPKEAPKVPPKSSARRRRSDAAGKVQDRRS